MVKREGQVDEDLIRNARGLVVLFRNVVNVLSHESAQDLTMFRECIP